MENKALPILLIILFCLSYIAAVPATRSSMIRKVDPFVLDHQEDLAMDLRNNEELFDMKQYGLEERMMMDIADYPPIGANPIHDPKPPPGKP
ncbi:hypothetical protein RIF29_19651 [Crotalaria pallida]|uniref:Uncharacterized protein n=1 Tax=Crotalaria pallida TaxID=3830 RepID=A0AAN9F1N3_CROPI